MGISNLFDTRGAGSGGDAEDDTPEDYAAGVPEEPDGPSADALPPDPKPRRSGRGRRVAPPPAAKVTAAQKRSVEDSIFLLMMIPGGAIRLRDPHCGQAITANAREVAKACVPIVARNPNVLAWFVAAGAPFMDWLALASALSPIAAAFWSHHVTKTAGQDAAGGEDAPDYSQFTAPAFG
jgi:hypothetical protein